MDETIHCGHFQTQKISFVTICESYTKKLDDTPTSVRKTRVLQRIDEANTKLKATQEVTVRFNSEIIYSYIDCTHNTLTVIKCGNIECIKKRYHI